MLKIVQNENFTTKYQDVAYHILVFSGKFVKKKIKLKTLNQNQNFHVIIR